MAKKKSKKTEKQHPETKENEMKQEENFGSAQEPVEEKQSELEIKLRKQVDELKDSNLRLHAEFDNYRKRTIKEKIELSKTASEEVISELLPVLDDLERALQNLNNNADDAFIEGIKLIYNKLLRTLTSKGLEEMQAMGLAFDTDFHEAISHFPATDENQKDKIVDVVQKGYKLHGKVIRFAKVVVGS
ncbi:MAG: nucleotide exchange factor GrpE [Bacteroidales bacterium]|nr:nucleotide exchange factor GrpE [Bacteroidales bacterium]